MNEWMQWIAAFTTGLLVGNEIAWYHARKRNISALKSPAPLSDQPNEQQ